LPPRVTRGYYSPTTSLPVGGLVIKHTVISGKSNRRGMATIYDKSRVSLPPSSKSIPYAHLDCSHRRDATANVHTHQSQTKYSPDPSRPPSNPLQHIRSTTSRNMGEKCSYCGNRSDEFSCNCASEYASTSSFDREPTSLNDPNPVMESGSSRYTGTSAATYTPMQSKEYVGKPAGSSDYRRK
jgi:hypothetical protein